MRTCLHLETLSLSNPLLRALGALGFALLIGLGAHIKIFLPFTPVPITFQTLFLLIGANLLTRHFALQMIGWYLLLGFLGLPLFAHETKGVAYLLGPTGGYLIGFVLASALLGYFQSRSAWRQYALFLLAHTLIFVPGVVWLHHVTQASWTRTLEMGLTPFLVGDLLKSSTAFACWWWYRPRGQEL